jgi:hypothetical protein
MCNSYSRIERFDDWQLQLKADSGGRFSLCTSTPLNFRTKLDFSFFALGKSALQDALAFSATIDDGSDAQRGGHLFLQTRNATLLTPRWKWIFCRIAADAASQQQQQQQQQLSSHLLVFDSIESSSDYTSKPLLTIPLQCCRCQPHLVQVRRLQWPHANKIKKFTIPALLSFHLRAGASDEL